MVRDSLKISAIRGIVVDLGRIKSVRENLNEYIDGETS